MEDEPLTSHDRSWGPFTFGGPRPVRPGGPKLQKARRLRFSISYGSGGGEEQSRWNRITVYTRNHALRILLPRLLKPAVRKEEKYSTCLERQYGITVRHDSLSIDYGVMDDSGPSKTWYWYYPFMEWRLARVSIYDPGGAEVMRCHGRYSDTYEARRAVSREVFYLRDFDGAVIRVRTLVEEREYHLGRAPWWAWLALVVRPHIDRMVDMEFSSEVGREKGSWKGGVLGTGIKLRPGETTEEAVERWCLSELRSPPEFLGRTPPPAYEEA